MYVQITIITNVIIYTHKINVICIYIIYYAYNKCIVISCDAQYRVVNHFCIEKYNKIQYFVALCDKSNNTNNNNNYYYYSKCSY